MPSNSVSVILALSGQLSLDVLKDKMMKHTPSPWIVKPPGSIICHPKDCVVKNEVAFDWVASVQVSNVDEWQANARLISAAPELLARLKKVTDILIALDDSQFRKVIELNQVEINKAEGK